MVMRLPREILDGFNVGKEPVGDETTDAETRASIEKMWRAACPGTSGCDDLLINPFVGSSLANLECKRGGEAEIVESKGEPHIFYLLSPTCDSAVAMRKKIASFFNEI
ncbi:hypothetical protein CUMW_265410 [Citrus unshiu]|uniref:Alpha/beta hydrolase fold-3 domain-containing protein n=1 Tax=Citrus unshiu TaxID=55188 RepID=A0A2H5QWC0_CITUN|nr:hypothetical protein CUMW_265410 [Citrus unshiu]